MQNSGSITAIDVEPEVLKIAEKNLSTVTGTTTTVQQGDVYSLPFPDNSFDIVHAHQVLQHLSDPVFALREMKRVCKGHVCVRDVDYRSWMFYPEDVVLDKWLESYRNVCKRNEANPDAGRYLIKWFGDAGVSSDDLSVKGEVVLYSKEEEKKQWGETWAMRSTETKLAEQAIGYGFSTKEETLDFGKAWRKWAVSDHSMMYYVDVVVTAKVT